MPYGQGQMLGAGVDPRMFVQDYSGFTRAAEIQAQGMQNLGAMIGRGIADFGEARKERKKIDAEIKATSAGIESAIKMGKDLGIDIESYLAPVQAKINDPNTSPVEALALGRTAAQGISNAFTLGIGAQERSIASQRARDENAFKLANLEVAQQRANIYGQKAQAEASELTRDVIKAVDPETGQDKEWDVLRDKQGNLFTPDKKSRIVDPDKYIYGEPGGVQELPPTSQVGGISDSIASAAEMNIGKLSTAKTPGTQGGNVGCADAVCRTFKQATGEELVPGGTLSTREMATNLGKDPRFVKVSLNEAQKGDIVLTPRKGNKAGHTGIVLDGGKIASNSSKGFDGEAPGTFSLNYSISKWNKSITPRNPSETAAYRYIGPQGIDNALSMGGDMSSQAMGTPEQQAQVANQIERNQSLNTAQAGQPNQMSTEPSINQQPQPAPRRMVGGRPVGGRATQGTIMSAEQVKNLTDRGFKVDAIPNNDGNFTVSGVTAGGQTPRYTKTPQEELQTQRLTTLDKLQSDVRATGVAAAQDIAPFKEIVGLLDTSVKTGFGRQTLMTAKKVLGADVSNEEQFQARVGELAMRNIALTKGAISDREMDYFKTVLSPNMGKTTEGNKKIIEFKIKYAERADTIAKTISKMQSQGADPYVIQSEVDKIIESTPLVTVGSTPTSPSSQAEADASFLQGFQSGE
jgi:hypothetical protein